MSTSKEIEKIKIENGVTYVLRGYFFGVPVYSATAKVEEIEVTDPEKTRR
jgi:hypothetical protein